MNKTRCCSHRFIIIMPNSNLAKFAVVNNIDFARTMRIEPCSVFDYLFGFCLDKTDSVRPADYARNTYTSSIIYVQMKYEMFLIDFKARTDGRFIRVPRVARRAFSTEVGTVRCNATNYARVKHALTRSQNATLSRRTKHADQAIQFLTGV